LYKVRNLRAPQQRSADTKRRILDAAAAEFGDHGFSGASTRTIAANAAVQHALVRYHFGDKESLWRAVIRELVSEHKAWHDAQMLELQEVEPVVKLRKLQEEFIRFSAAAVPYHRIMAHVAERSNPQLTWVIDEYLRDVYDQRAELIRAAQAAGKYVLGDPYHLQYLFLGAVTRIFLLAGEVEQIAGHNPLSPEFLQEHERICLSLFFRD
jgi:TetR/AcrR family transcriptional regulator